MEPKDWLFIVGLLAAVILVYQPALHGGILWDDDMHVTRPGLRSWHGLYRTWFEVGATVQYYPLLHTAFWIEHRLWGDATLGYHLVNILEHAAAALMAALVLRRLKIPGAYLAAAIFALHPIQAESVAWITEQKNTLSALFYLGAVLVYLRFDQSRKRSSYGWALGLYLLGILSKTVIATLPGALLVIFWWQRGRLSWKHDVLPLVPFLLLGAGGGMITAWWELQINKCVGPEFTLTVVERFLIAGRTVWFLLWKLVWPAQLTFSYPRWEINTGMWWQYAFPLGAVGVLAVLWSMRRRARAPLAAALFYGGTLFPMLGFFNLFTFLYSFVANHYQYLAGLGVITLVAAGAAVLLDRWGLWNRPGGYVLCLAPLVILSGLTWQQSRMYADMVTLYRTTIAENPGSWMAYNNLGMALAERRQYDEAMVNYRKGLELKPDDAYAHNNLGVALMHKGRIDEAIACFRKALEYMPNYSTAHNNLGGLLFGRGQADEAIYHFRRAAECDPNDPVPRDNVEIAIAQRDYSRKLRAEQAEILRSRPNDVSVLSSIAWMRATNSSVLLRNGAEAVDLAQRAVQLSGGRDPTILGTLAAAYAEAGRFPDAVETAQQALALASGPKSASLAVSLRARLKLYQSGFPYHEPQQASAPKAGQPLPGQRNGPEIHR